ncbi:Isochorismate synthase DhbC [compost metagenome]
MLKYEAALAVSAAELLEEYQADNSFFLASPDRTLLAQGVWARLPVQNAREGNEDPLLLQSVAELLAASKRYGHGVPLVVGAIPFNPSTSPQLAVPMTARWADKLSFPTNSSSASPSVSVSDIQWIPSQKEYMEGVNHVLTRMTTGELSKVVLSRTLRLTSPHTVNIHQLLRNLALNNPYGYTFAVPFERTLIGASPELLVTKAGALIKANPLAGSAARSKDPVLDQRIANDLLASAKDLHEHAVVIDAVAAALRPYCRKLEVPSQPSLIKTNTMWHLSTEIYGELKSTSTSSLELAMALHPTPAVCGTPTKLAREAIQEIEPFDRNLFTGMVGWCHENGDGEWIVTIRCAEIEDRNMVLYAGAGVVAGSTAESELAETSAKFRTMLEAMGLDSEPLSKAWGDQ